MKKLSVMERLNREIMRTNSRVVAGLDPVLSEIPDCEEYRKLTDRGVLMETYCHDYIKAIAGIVPAIKINSAFFEAEGLTLEYFEVAEMAAKAGMIVIGDLKRADIGSTSEAYAKAYLNADSPFDIITVNPYFGADGVKPFIELANQNEKGVFVLVKTSNASSVEIQDMMLIGKRKVYELVADLVNFWGIISDSTDSTEDGYNNVGAVVGATHPDDARRLRQRMPNTFFLVPGYGAQGATAEDVVVNFDKNGLGAIVNSSRGLMNAYKHPRWKNQFSEENWAEATTAEAKRMTEEINKALHIL